MTRAKLIAWLATPAGNMFGHIFEGVVLALIVGVPVAFAFSVKTGAVVGWLFQAAYFLGRERRDHEIDTKLDPVTDWLCGWNIFAWSKDGQQDLFAPIIAVGLFAAGVFYLG